jgi:hypothetical protein
VKKITLVNEAHSMDIDKLFKVCDFHYLHCKN